MAVLNLNEKLGGVGTSDDVEVAGTLKVLGSGKTIQFGVTRSVAAAGSSVANATSITAAVTEVLTTAASTGVIFPSFKQGEIKVVANRGANTLSVYPPAGGNFTTGLAANAAYSIGSSAAACFFALADGIIAPVA